MLWVQWGERGSANELRHSALMVRKTTCLHMCTCCITWWPWRPVFCWIERSRHSWAVLRYVTGWAHAFLSVCCGVSRGTTGVPSKPRSDPHSTAAPPEVMTPVSPPHLSPPVSLFTHFLLSPILFGKKDLVVSFWPRCAAPLMPVCLSRSHPSLPFRVLSMSKIFVQGFQQHFNTHSAAVASVYIMSDYAVSFFCWFCQHWWELVRRTQLKPLFNLWNLAIIINKLPHLPFSLFSLLFF